MTSLILAAMLLAPQAAPPQNHDYAGLKRQMPLFESLLNAAMRQRFGYGILQEAKGTYLEGYGAVFTLELNLFPMRFISPFSPSPYSEKEIRDAREKKLARMKELEELLRELLREPGPGLNFLHPDENVAIVVHFFNVAEHRDLPSQLVVQGKRQDLRSNKISMVTF